MKYTITEAAKKATEATTTKKPHGWAFEVLFDEAVEALAKSEEERKG